jgi:methyl-accepting chemotaxis protein
VLTNLKISRKLAFGFAAVLAVMLAMSTALYFALQSIDSASAANAQSSDMVNDVDNAMEGALDMISGARSYVLSRRPLALKIYENAVEANAVGIAAARSRSIGYRHEKDAAPLFDKLDAAFAAWKQEIGEPGTAAARDAATLEKAREIVASDRSADLVAALRKAANEAKSAISAWSGEDQSAQSGEVAAGRMTLYAGVPAAVLIAILIGWMLSRAIAAPVVAMTGAMTRLAGGDHEVDVPAAGRKDEIGSMAEAVQSFKAAAIEKQRLEEQATRAARAAEALRRDQDERNRIVAEGQHVFSTALAGALQRLSGGDLAFRLNDPFMPELESIRADFNAAVGKLQETMVTVGSNTYAIRSGTGEISSAADDLSRRTEQQAASLEETAASLDEITATVNRTAEGARHARDIVGAAKADAEKSGEIVRQAIDAMSGIEKSSKQIGQIIGVIDEIAFQTNLLALNAGVEAARAGDAGRGFAVVASEVRALAQRSAEAAKEIKGLISASTAQVDQGVDLVGQAGTALQRIVDKVAEINAEVSAIAASAQEQATGLRQVNTAVNQMDQVTQQNAAMVEETTAAARSLSQETEQLSHLIGNFQTGRSTGPEPARPAQRPTHARLPASKTTARSGSTVAARKPTPAKAEDTWEEF